MDVLPLARQKDGRQLAIDNQAVINEVVGTCSLSQRVEAG